MTAPDELTRITDTFTKTVSALLPADRHDAMAAFVVALSDLLAAIIGRSTVMAAGAAAQANDRAQREVMRLEARLDAQAERIFELSRRLDAAKDSLERDLTVLAESLPPLEALYRLAVRVEQMEAQHAAKSEAQ